MRNLRGNKAEDIIFTGSSTRRPLGAAEVSVTFDNSDGKLPIDFQEVMITRRIFRSGESEFLINKTKCRLKDIYNLFADTGLGKNSISVISQNKVDEVLNTKPEERRYFFEECAGITKYRERKREAVRKLDNTQANVVRLNDIVSEIEKQLEPLKEQADKTRRYNVIDKEYKDCRLTQILYKYENLSAENNKLDLEIKGYEQERASLEATVSVSESEKIAKKSEINKLEQKIKLLGENNQKIHEEIERSRNQATLLQERIRQSCQSQQRLEERQNQTKEELKISLADGEELKRKAQIANNTADKLELALQEENSSVQKVENDIIKPKDDRIMELYQENLKLHNELLKQVNLVKVAEKYQKERDKILADNIELHNQVENIKAEYKDNEFDLEWDFKKQIKKLETGNNHLHKIIDKFYETIEKFIDWICHKFSIGESKKLIKDFQEETNTFIDPIKQLEHEDMEKEWDLER